MISYLFEIKNLETNKVVDRLKINKHFNKAKKEVIYLLDRRYIRSAGKKSFSATCVGKEFSHPHIHVYKTVDILESDVLFSTQFKAMSYGTMAQKLKYENKHVTWMEIEKENENKLKKISKKIILKLNNTYDIEWKYEKFSYEYDKKVK